jgi:uncharacterized protein (DUF433 family)
VTHAIAGDPETMHGQPVFRGTRVPVQTRLDHLEGTDTLDGLLEGFPGVSRTRALEALEEAKQLLPARASVRLPFPAHDCQTARFANSAG